VTAVSFGEWLKRQRKAQGWTQKELAFQVNCSISTIRKIEAEHRRPSAQIVGRLIEVFHIPPNERTVFLDFARGDWLTLPREPRQGTALPLSHLDPRLNSLQSMMNFIDTEEGDGFLRSVWESANVSEKFVLICRALEMAESTGDTRGQLESLWQLGWLDQTKRFDYWEKALALTRVLGDAYELASGLSTAGLFLALNGDLNAAQKYLAESNALYEQLHMKPVISHLLSAYGQISLIRVEFKKARAYLQEHARASLELGSRQDYLWSYVRLGFVALREGKAKEASHTFVECAQEFKKDRNIIGVVFTLEGLAELFVETDSLVRAAQLVGWADSTREKISDRRPLLEQADIDKIIELSITRMGKAQFSKAYDEGKKMSLDKAVAFALRDVQ
jgi:transcriptional regulator with XRE-family HTH domain